MLIKTDALLIPDESDRLGPWPLNFFCAPACACLERICQIRQPNIDATGKKALAPDGRSISDPSVVR